MAHFAKVIDGVVTHIITAEPEFFDTFVDDIPGEWVQTSYNTRGGQHLLGGEPLRKNYAGIGFTYDHERDAFIPPKTFDSWILNEETCLWEAPVPMPADASPEKIYMWSEIQGSWYTEDE